MPSKIANAAMNMSIKAAKAAQFAAIGNKVSRDAFADNLTGDKYNSLSGIVKSPMTYFQELQPENPDIHAADECLASDIFDRMLNHPELTKLKEFSPKQMGDVFGNEISKFYQTDEAQKKITEAFINVLNILYEQNFERLKYDEQKGGIVSADRPTRRKFIDAKANRVSRKLCLINVKNCNKPVKYKHMVNLLTDNNNSLIATSAKQFRNYAGDDQFDKYTDMQIKDGKSKTIGYKKGMLDYRIKITDVFTKILNKMDPPAAAVAKGGRITRKRGKYGKKRGVSRNRRYAKLKGGAEKSALEPESHRLTNALGPNSFFTDGSQDKQTTRPPNQPIKPTIPVVDAVNVDDENANKPDSTIPVVDAVNVDDEKDPTPVVQDVPAPEGPRKCGQGDGAYELSVVPDYYPPSYKWPEIESLVKQKSSEFIKTTLEKSNDAIKNSMLKVFKYHLSRQSTDYSTPSSPLAILTKKRFDDLIEWMCKKMILDARMVGVMKTSFFLQPNATDLIQQLKKNPDNVPKFAEYWIGAMPSVTYPPHKNATESIPSFSVPPTDIIPGVLKSDFNYKKYNNSIMPINGYKTKNAYIKPIRDAIYRSIDAILADDSNMADIYGIYYDSALKFFAQLLWMFEHNKEYIAWKIRKYVFSHIYVQNFIKEVFNSNKLIGKTKMLPNDDANLVALLLWIKIYTEQNGQIQLESNGKGMQELLTQLQNKVKYPISPLVGTGGILNDKLFNQRVEDTRKVFKTLGVEITN